MLNVELELKAERENAELRLKDVDEYEKVYQAEWKILYDKLDKIAVSGAKVCMNECHHLLQRNQPRAWQKISIFPVCRKVRSRPGEILSTATKESNQTFANVESMGLSQSG